MRRFRIPSLLATAVLLLSCTDAEKTPTSPPNVNLASSQTVDAQIDALFPNGLARVGHARWASVQRLGAEGNTTVARKQALQLIDWIMKKYDAGVLLDPNGAAPPTTERAVGVLTASIFSVVYPDETAPSVDILENNGAIVIVGSEEETVTTPEEDAAVHFQANTFDSEVLVVVEEIPATTYDPGDGPLAGPYEQYPGYFHISTFPATPNNLAVRIAICFDLEGPYAPPPSAIPGLRIGHELHTTPPTIDVLNRVDVDDLLHCDGDGEGEKSTLQRSRTGWVQKSVGMLADAARSAVKVFTPTRLYALHVGVGGELEPMDGFSEFGIVSTQSAATVCTTTNPGDPSSFDNFADAVGWVSSGGTIEVCPGTYETNDVVIQKPLTIRRQAGTTRPVITNADSALASFIVDSMVDAGSVVIRGLRFVPSGYSSIFAQGFYDQLTAVDNEFALIDGAVTSLYAGWSGFPGSKMLFDINAVTGGSVGVFVPGGNAEVLRSTFDSSSFAGIQFQGRATGVIAWNSVTNCGYQGCIRARLANTVNVHHNTVSSPWARGVAFGIIADTGQVSIEDNTVTGIGTFGPLTTDSSYAFRRAGIQVGLGGGYTQGIVNRNTISNAATGLNARTGSITGADNVISNVKRGFLTEGSSPVINALDNDITGYVFPWNNAVGSNLTCNWWGSTSGPSNIASSTAGYPTYEPWATGPVANAGTGACDGYHVILGADRARSAAAPALEDAMAPTVVDAKPKRVGERATKLRGKAIYLY